MVGVHVGAATASDQVFRRYLDMFDELEDYKYRPVDVGLMVHVAFERRLYVVPWVGVQLGWRRLECGRRSTSAPCETTDWELLDGVSPAFGLSAGWDVAKHGPNRVSVSGSIAMASSSAYRSFTYSALSVGVAYRFWAP